MIELMDWLQILEVELINFLSHLPLNLTKALFIDNWGRLSKVVLKPLVSI